jgi:hypothetical protein
MNVLKLRTPEPSDTPRARPRVRTGGSTQARSLQHVIELINIRGVIRWDERCSRTVPYIIAANVFPPISVKPSANIDVSNSKGGGYEVLVESISLTVHELEGEESQVLGAQVCTGRPEVPGLDRRGDGTVGGYLAVASLVEVQAAVEEENPCMG